MPDMADKVRESRIRRIADRRGLRLVKSGRRDPNALDYGLYALIDYDTGGAVNPSLIGRYTCSWTLDQIEDYLAEPEQPHKGDQEQRAGRWQPDLTTAEHP
jgi:hypothetical protein